MSQASARQAVRRPRAGYTLIELLVSVGIIVLILALLFPAFSKAVAVAQSVKCANNLRQIYTMEMQFAAENGNKIGAANNLNLTPAASDNMMWSDWLIGARNRTSYFPGSHPVKSVPRNDYNILLCPSQRPKNPATLAAYYNYLPETGSIYRTYGILHGGGRTIAGYTIDWIHDGWHYLGSVPAPATIPMMADTVAYSGGAAKLQLYYFYPNTFTENGGMHLRHNGKANVLFYDGHVSALGRQDLADLDIKQAVLSDLTTTSLP
jgi:prepilin-type processing-associated H-X9-DG protein/prepilin-type N-terminal cleavage/methylation domain-containing protein